MIGRQASEWEMGRGKHVMFVLVLVALELALKGVEALARASRRRRGHV